MDLPDEALFFLLGSRYCDTDRLGDFELFRYEAGLLIGSQCFVPLFFAEARCFACPISLKNAPSSIPAPTRHFADAKLAHEIEGASWRHLSRLRNHRRGDDRTRENKLQNIGKAARRPAISQATLHLILCLAKTVEFLHSGLRGAGQGIEKRDEPCGMDR